MTLLRIIAVGLFTYSTFAFATPWAFVKSEDGITIHKRDHGNGLIEVRAQMQVETSYSGFLLLLEDSDNVPNWIDNVSRSEVLMQISANENIVYTQFKAPWPARDRDMVTYSKYEVEDGQFTLTIKDASNYLAKESGYIRIRDVDAIWTLQPLTNGFTHINYTAYANAGGILPDWLMNRLSRTTPLAPFKNSKINYQSTKGNSTLI